MRTQKNPALSAVVLILAACGLALPSTEGRTQGSSTAKPVPFTIDMVVVFPIDKPNHLPGSFREAARQGLDGCGSWKATGAIEDEGEVASEKMHFFGTFTPTGLTGTVGETDIFDSDRDGSFVIDSILEFDRTDSSHEASCVFKGGTRSYANLRGGSCQLTGRTRFGVPGDAPDLRCFNGMGCPGPFCVVVEQTIKGRISVDNPADFRVSRNH